MATPSSMALAGGSSARSSLHSILIIGRGRLEEDTRRDGTFSEGMYRLVGGRVSVKGSSGCVMVLLFEGAIDF
jgi:hypothetical protein